MEINVWIDGSCIGNPGPGGWAVVFPYLPREGERREFSGLIGSPTTNNSAELLALLRAIELVRETRPVTLVVHTDSQMVIDWMTGVAQRRKSHIRNLCGTAESHARFRKVTLEFVKASEDAEPEQQRADKLAKEAAREAAERERGVFFV